MKQEQAPSAKQTREIEPSCSLCIVPLCVFLFSQLLSHKNIGLFRSANVAVPVKKHRQEVHCFVLLLKSPLFGLSNDFSVALSKCRKFT